MKFWEKCKKQSWFSYSVAICIGILFYSFIMHFSVVTGFLENVWKIFKPLFYGLILAYLLDPVARFYQNKPFKKMKNKKVARSISVVLAIVSMLLFFALLGMAIFPQLIKSIVNIVEMATSAISDIEANSAEYISALPFGIGSSLQNVSVSDNMLESVSSFLSDNFSNIADTSATIGNGFANSIIAFVLAIYYMMDKDRLKGHATRLLLLVLHEKKFNTFKAFCKRADKILLRYIFCNLVEAICVGTLNGILMLIFRMPYILLVSVVVGVTNIAPTFGPIVGALIGAIMLVLINPVYALVFLIFTVVIQTIDGYILKPKLFGETLGVSPLLIMITIIIGGRIFGVICILLAIPFAAIAYYVVGEIAKNSKNNHQLSQNADGEKPAEE